MELIDTAAASRFQRRSDFICQCVGKEILIYIAESIFGDGYYFNEQDCRWYCFDKCLKRGRRIFSCELDCKITKVIFELQLLESNTFDIKFLSLAGMRIIRDKIKSLSADNWTLDKQQNDSRIPIANFSPIISLIMSLIKPQSVE